MNLRTALRDFEQITGKPLAILNDEIREYGVKVEAILNGQHQPGFFLLTELGDILATSYNLPIETIPTAIQWDMLYKTMEECQAFRQYCQEAHGNALIQMNELDNGTLEQIVGLLQLDSTHTAADIGCGNGSLTEYLSDRSGRRFIGMDASIYAIRLAEERTQAKSQRLTFRIGDINQAWEVLEEFSEIDTIVAMEVLFASQDLERTLQDFTYLLRGKGQMLLIANQHVNDSHREAERLLPEGTDISRAAFTLGLPTTVYDLTPAKLAYLERSISLLKRYEEAFRREGQHDFWAARMIYDRKMIKRVQEGLTKRFMVHITIK